MTIKKISSQEVMKTIEDANETINGLTETLENFTRRIHRKQKITYDQARYANTLIGQLDQYNPAFEHEYSLTAPTVIKQSEYEIFGTTLHPPFKHEIDLFNLSTESGILFREDVRAEIGYTPSELLLESLKHESIQKEPFYGEFEEKNLELNFYIQQEKRLGHTFCNMIEFSPILPGSFDITGMSVVVEGETLETILLTRTTIRNAGGFRLFLEEALPISQLRIEIALHDTTETFGLHHLYLKNTAVKETGSLIFEIEKPYFIHTVHENIELDYFHETKKTTLSAEGIKIFTSMDRGELGFEVIPSTDVNANVILRNTRKLFIEVPNHVFRRGLERIRFDNIQRR